MDFKVDLNLNAIDALANLISTSVSDLKNIQSAEIFAVEKGEAATQGEAANTDARIACLCIASAAAQLMTLIRPPEQVVFDMAMSFHLPSALRLVIESHVPEILREKGESAGSVHVNAISKINGVNAHKLGHIMRLLATHYIFDEVEPNVFANNRLSATLDTGKLLEDVLSSPHEKYESKHGGFAALIAVTTHESMRNAQFMTDVLTDSNLTDSFMPEDSPFALAMWPGSTSVARADQTDGSEGPAKKKVVKRLDMFEWMSTTPENRWRLTRFGNAMMGVSQLTPPDAILKGFQWSSLPADSVVVDVGGGIGSASLPILKNAPVKLIIQDKGVVIEDAENYWREHFPDALSLGRIEFMDHDFFEPQPSLSAKGNPIVFLLRMIMHNWADEHAKIILKHLRDVAKVNEGVKLVIVDGLLKNACRAAVSESSVLTDGLHVDKKEEEPPVPLLANWGAANGMAYKFDLQMLCNHNAGERTLDEFAKLLAETGWRIVEVHQMQQSWMPQVVAVPDSSEKD